MSVSERQLSTGEVRRRAVVGAVVDTLRASGVRLVGLVGTIAVARLATPHQLGLVAIGATVIAFADLLDDGGVGTALIRRAEPATTTELRALLAFQLAVDFALVIVIGLAMLPFGLLGQVTTVIAFSLPIGAFRAPGTVTCERRLSYRALAVTDIAQTCVYYTWTVGALVLGGGVWALATGFVVREASGALLLLKLVPEGRMTPAPAWAPLKPLLSFGVKFQAVGLLHMLRDQGVNILVATLGGVSMLGLWSVAWRLIQLPVSLVSSLWRVSMPGMARLVAAKEDVGGTIDRVISLSAIGTGVLLVPLAASAPAWVRVLLGPQWVDAASVIPGACLAMAFGIPISVTLAGYLWALGNASVPLRATAAGIPPTLALVVGLLPHIGPRGCWGRLYRQFARGVDLLRGGGKTDRTFQRWRGPGGPSPGFVWRMAVRMVGEPRNGSGFGERHLRIRHCVGRVRRGARRHPASCIERRVESHRSWCPRSRRAPRGSLTPATCALRAWA